MASPHKSPSETNSTGGLQGAGLQAEMKLKAVQEQFKATLLPKTELLENATERFLIYPPRKQLIMQFVMLLSVALLLILLSIGALTYFLLPFWLYLSYCGYAFIKLCNLYGYSAFVIIILFLIGLAFVVFVKIMFHLILEGIC